MPRVVRADRAAAEGEAMSDSHEYDDLEAAKHRLTSAMLSGQRSSRGSYIGNPDMVFVAWTDLRILLDALAECRAEIKRLNEEAKR
jgi:hypothetical protein